MLGCKMGCFEWKEWSDEKTEVRFGFSVKFCIGRVSFKSIGEKKFSLTSPPLWTARFDFGFQWTDLVVPWLV